MQSVAVQDVDLAAALEFPSLNHYLACIQYLFEKKLVRSAKDDSGRYITLTIEAIDFLESA